MKVSDVAIVGAGPAGLSCAIQLKRYGIDPLVFEKGEVGGLLNSANLVENYPGFTGIPGKELVKYFKNHFFSLDLDTIKENVVEVDFNEVFKITTDSKVYFAKILVIASGTSPKTLDIGYDKVFYDIAQLHECKNKRILIVGSGDAAFDYAINLAESNKVKILNRSDKVKCLPLLWDRSKSIKNIEYCENTEITSVEKTPEELIVTLNSKNKILADFILVAVGRSPDIGFLTPQIVENKQRFTDNGVLHIIGDAANGMYRQTAIACGNGIEAAMKIYTCIDSDILTSLKLVGK